MTRLICLSLLHLLVAGLIAVEEVRHPWEPFLPRALDLCLTDHRRPDDALFVALAEHREAPASLATSPWCGAWQERRWRVRYLVRRSNRSAV
jgi:hypothetical protein